MGIAESISKLISISREKKSLLEEMLDITKQQSQIIEQKNMDKLGQLIGEKQKRIDKINALDNEFELYFGKIKDECGVKNVADILKSGSHSLTQLKTGISGIMEVIDKIKNIEKENHINLSQQKNELSDKIKQISKGKMAANVYKGKYALPPKPAFFDKKK